MIRIRSLNKFYGKKQVLFDLNLDFPTGITGILGHNGAGKTTLFKCITGTERFQGSIEIPGNKRIGYLPQDFDCFHDLTAEEAMEYLGLLKETPLSKEEYGELLKRVELYEERRTKVKKLSGGMRRRLGVAQAMIGRPDIVLMDEPTAGLDPEGRIQVRNMIAGFAKDATIVISSHIASDLEALAESLVFLKEGKVCLAGRKEEILDRMQGKVSEVTMEEEEFLRRKAEISYTSMRLEQGKVRVRLVDDDVPKENAVLPGVEDAFFYFA